MKYALRALLMGAPAVTALVGNRIEWGRAAQGAALPMLVLNVVSDVGSHHLNGPNQLRQHRVQIDSYGDTPPQVHDLGEAVRSVLDGYQGGNFQGIFFMVARDFGDDAERAEEATRPYRVSADYEIHWSNSNA